jgi:hypothetical protein
MQLREKLLLREAQRFLVLLKQNAAVEELQGRPQNEEGAVLTCTMRKRTHWTGDRSADTAFLNLPTDAFNCQNINVKGGGQARPERRVPTLHG